MNVIYLKASVLDYTQIYFDSLNTNIKLKFIFYQEVKKK